MISNPAFIERVVNFTHLAGLPVTSNKVERWSRRWRQWKAFCEREGFSPLPVSLHQADRYLLELAAIGRSDKALAEEVRCLRIFSQAAGFIPPWTDGAGVRDVLADHRQRTAKRRVPSSTDGAIGVKLGWFHQYTLDVVSYREPPPKKVLYGYFLDFGNIYCRALKSPTAFAASIRAGKNALKASNDLEPASFIVEALVVCSGGYSSFAKGIGLSGELLGFYFDYPESWPREKLVEALGALSWKKLENPGSWEDEIRHAILRLNALAVPSINRLLVRSGRVLS